MINETPKAVRKDSGRVITEKEVLEKKDAKKTDELETIDIVITIPKPEALIFANKMKTRYDIPLGMERNFSEKIIEDAKTKIR